MSPCPAGRPGPVLVDVPKDIQQQLAMPDWDQALSITAYLNRLPPQPEMAQLMPVLKALQVRLRPLSQPYSGVSSTSSDVMESGQRQCRMTQQA